MRHDDDVIFYDTICNHITNLLKEAKKGDIKLLMVINVIVSGTKSIQNMDGIEPEINEKILNILDD